MALTARGEGHAATAAWLVGLTLLSFLLHLPFLRLPMISDEGGYAYVAQRWLDGRGTLYDDIWVSRPQGIFLAYGAIFETIGTSVAALRIGAWIVSMLTMLLVWRYASAWAGRRAAMAATLIYALIAASPAVEGFTANAEVFMAPAAAGCALLLLRASRTGWAVAPLVGAGALAGIATLLKPSGIVMVPVALAFLWFAAAGGTGVALRRGPWVAVGFGAALLPAFVHGYLVGWDNFVYAAITYRINHQSSATNSPAHHARAFYEMISRCWPLIALVLLPLLLRWWTQRERGAPAAGWATRLTGDARVGIAARVAARPVAQAGDEAGLLLRLWLLGCLAGIAMGGDWWFHYLIQIAAPLAIWLAAALLEVRPLLARRGRWAMAGAVAFCLLWPYHVVTAGSPGAISRDLYGHPGYPDQMPVARYLQEHTPPETPIFIAFDQAALYYLADRPAVYRYLYDQELRALPESQADLIAIIESPYRPMYVVGTRQVAPFPDRGLAFWDAVGRNYHVETIIRGVPILRANIPPPRQLTPDV